MKSHNRNRLPGMVCPHCSGRTDVRTSKVQTPLIRDLIYHCQNTSCGHVFTAQLVAVRTLVPSIQPRAGIDLPVPTFARPANDRAPAPANDFFGPRITG